jgi:uroporphyrinogen decarboxylase
VKDPDLAMTEPLDRASLRRFIEGRGAARRVPLTLHQWIGARTFGARAPAVQALLDRYPNDVQTIPWCNVRDFEAPPDAPTFRWATRPKPADWDQRPLDERAVIADWSELEAFLAEFPDADYPGMFPARPPADGRYRLVHWWYTFFERHWALRGMTNALTDYHFHPDETRRLFAALTAFYRRIIRRAREELDADGVYCTDDLGTQTSTFFSPEVFETFYVPCYRELIDEAHRLGMHFWLHTCGCIRRFLPRLIEIGLDVIHPIQKYTMDETEIARAFGGQIAFWVGFDVQQIIPYGTPDQVRAEVRHLFDAFRRPDGRFLFTFGNGVTADAPLASLEALFDEALRYGSTEIVNCQGLTPMLGP